MGSEESEYSISMAAMRTAARNNIYHNPMAISQTLPALQKQSYLKVKGKECLNEDSMFSHCDFKLFLLFYCLIMCLLSHRHFSAGHDRSCCAFTKWHQSGSDSGGGDVQWSSSCLSGGRAKGQLPARGSRPASDEKCWLHVSLSHKLQ